MRQANVEFGVASLGAVVSVFGIVHAMAFPHISAYLPTAVLSLLMLLCVVWAIKSLVALRRTRAERLQFRKDEVRRFAVLVVATLVLISVAPLLGFATSFLVFIPVTGYLLGYRKWQGLLLTSVVFTSLVYLVFLALLNRPLPPELLLRFF